VALVLVLAGCGGSSVKTVTERETVSVAAAAARHTASDAGGEPATSRAVARAARTRHAAARSRTRARWVACDANITVLRPHTSCGFAQNAFYGYWAADGSTPIDVWSPSTSRSYATDCTTTAARVTCRTSDGGRVRFPTSAVAAYSSAQAEAYLETHDVGPDTSIPDVDLDESSSASDDAPSYDDYDPSPGDEIPNYDNGTGYRVQCADGMYSQSGGRPGACSGHGGVG
jgi:hypothetical protein